MQQKQDKQDNHTHPGPGEHEEGESHFLLNVAKTVFLVAVLVAAWFFLDWLMGRK